MSEATATRIVQITNREGLHARAAVMLAETARRFQAKMELIGRDQRRAPATEVLQILALGYMPGEQVQLVASGEDAEAALDAMAELFANKFGEDTETHEPQGG